MKKLKEEWNQLNAEEQRVIIGKGTERAIYVCRQCESELYTSDDKFSSRCGWPSFDDEIKGAVKRIRHSNDNRIEIVCSNCDGHLGHVFEGERFTEKNTRHCVNSISMKFIEK